MSGLSTTEARGTLSEIISRAAYGRERVVLTRRGKKVAAVVPMEDLERLEAMEDEIDVAAARRALARSRTSGEKAIPWQKARAVLTKRTRVRR